MTLQEALSSKTLILTLSGGFPALSFPSYFGMVVNHDKNLSSVRISKIFITGLKAIPNGEFSRVLVKTNEYNNSN